MGVLKTWMSQQRLEPLHVVVVDMLLMWLKTTFTWAFTVTHPISVQLISEIILSD